MWDVCVTTLPVWCYPVNFFLPTVLSALLSLALGRSGRVFSSAVLPECPRLLLLQAVLFLCASQHPISWGFLDSLGKASAAPWGALQGQPGQCFASCQQSRKQWGCGCTQANKRRKLYHFVCKVCKYYDCFQCQSSNGTDTALHGVPCTMCSVANHQLRDLFVDFCEDTNFFWCEFYLHTRSKVEGLQKQHDLSLPGEGTQVPRSRRAMKWWAEHASAEQSLTSCGKSWYSEWGRRGGDASQWFTLCQDSRDLAEHRQWCMGCMACRGMISLRMWRAWLQTEGSHSHFLEVGHHSGAWVPSFQWKLRTCVISENFSLCLSSSAVK